VHVAYSLDAPEGPGIFYAHLMDPRAQFEVPAALVYGGGGSVAVASDDQTVAIAYEDPNSSRPRIALAVSRTAGHTFESKSIPVSSRDTTARTPPRRRPRPPPRHRLEGGGGSHGAGGDGEVK
jgi:hypothetical protein